MWRKRESDRLVSFISSYIIARATGLAFAATSGGANTDPDQKRQQAAFWLGLAEQAKRAFPLLITGRVVE